LQLCFDLLDFSDLHCAVGLFLPLSSQLDLSPSLQLFLEELDLELLRLCSIRRAGLRQQRS